jgi:hypothetical protein
MQPIKFLGFGDYLRSEYVRWVNENGIERTTHIRLILDRCEAPQGSLTPDDAELFLQAHRKHIAELGFGLKIPGKYHELGAVH